MHFKQFTPKQFHFLLITFLSVLIHKNTNAQDLETMSWSAIIAMSDSAYKDGGDTAYIIEDEAHDGGVRKGV